MTTSTASATAPNRSDLPDRADAFRYLLHAEWTKFRTVRGWVIALVVAALVTVLVGLLSALGSHVGCAGGPGGPGGSGGSGASGGPGGSDSGAAGDPSAGAGPSAGCQPRLPPLGPDGEAVSDSFSFVHKSLDGDGSITVRVDSLTGLIPAGDPSQSNPDGPNPLAGMQSGLVPWAKAGLIIKDGTTPGSAYAAVMTTGSNGVRMQDNYTQDVAGSPGTVSAGTPLWLRLSRSGDTITGFESSDGTAWTQVGVATLAGLPTSAQVGLLVASPYYEVTNQVLGGSSSTGGPSQATAVFDELTLQGTSSGSDWTGDTIGGDGGSTPDVFTEDAGRFTVTGSGDIAPAVGGPEPNTIERSGVGTFAGLIVLIVLGTSFITAEYRRGLIRTTFAASPRRGRVLAAKAIVLGVVTFGAGLVASAGCFWLVGWIERANGVAIIPVPWLTELRVVIGTAALLAVAAVFALAVGAVLRRSAGAVATVIVLVVLPYILAVASVLPVGPANWLLRLTPAAAFAIQQSIPQYPQVSAFYGPSTGYFPLAPFAGFGVLCLWTAAALTLAVVLIRRRDV